MAGARNGFQTSQGSGPLRCATGSSFPPACNGHDTVTDAITTPRHTDIAIIGSGIVGLSCAFHLQQLGRDCLLIDPHGFGRETSYGNAGSISIGNLLPQSTPGIMSKGLSMMFDADAPLKLDYGAWRNWIGWLLRFVREGGSGRVMPIIDAMHAINTASRTAWLDLAEGIDARELVADTGYLHVYGKESTFEAGAWERQLMSERGVSYQVLDAQQLRELEPGIGKEFSRAVFQDESLAMRDPGQFCQRLGDALEARGVQSFRAAVAQFRAEQGGYRIITDHGSVQAKAVVVAAGAWSNALLRDFNIRIPVIPARGYHLMYPNQADVVHRPTLWAERYMVLSPMVPGIRMTSIKELTAIGRDPHYHLIHRRDADARRLFPGLQGEVRAEWSGYRPCTPDSLPIIDRLDGHEVYLATGHGHLGLTQAPITGRLVADMMAAREPAIPLAPYRRARFE